MTDKELKLVVSVVGFLVTLGMDTHPEERKILEDMHIQLSRIAESKNPNERIQEDG